MNLLYLLYPSSKTVERVRGAVRPNKAGYWFVLAGLAFFAFSAKSQSVTLAWDRETAAGIAGYRVYQGTNSRAYYRTVDAGTNTQASLTGLVNGVTYFFAVTAYNSSGLESDFSNEVNYTPSGSTNQDVLILAAGSGTINAPFVVSNGVVYQTTLTSAANGGRAAYNFTLSQGGPYIVSAMVNAPNNSANSFFVNIDAEPTDPQNLWDIPMTSGFMSRTVSWKPNGAAQIFNLTPGSHQLIVRGREPNTQLSTITITPVHAVLEITKNSNGTVLLTGLAQTGHIYDVQASSNLTTWANIGSVAPDKDGAITFTDSAPATLPVRAYRLRDQGPIGML